MLEREGRPYCGSAFFDRLTRRKLLEDWDARPWRPDLAATLESRGGTRRRSIDQVGDHDLPGRRPAASGHVRSEAAGSEEVAGPWRPIATNVSGLEIGEAFPRLAGMADKLTVIRSLVGGARPITTPFRSTTAITPKNRRRSGAGRSSAPPSPSCKARSSRDSPVRQPLLSVYARPYNEPGRRAFWARPSSVPPDGAERATTWCSTA